MNSNTVTSKFLLAICGFICDPLVGFATLLISFLIFLGIVETGDAMPGGAIFLLAIVSVPVFGTAGIITNLKFKGTLLGGWITGQLALSALVIMVVFSRFL